MFCQMSITQRGDAMNSKMVCQLPSLYCQGFLTRAEWPPRQAIGKDTLTFVADAFQCDWLLIQR